MFVDSKNRQFRLMTVTRDWITSDLPQMARPFREARKIATIYFQVMLVNDYE
jgi:hypothetical protein